MDRYASGDREAFAEVYDAVAPRLFQYLRRRTRSVELAEDLLQQTFLQMHRACGTFVPGSAVSPWAFAIARRLFIDECRRGHHDVLSGDMAIEAASCPSPDSSGPEGFTVAKELGRMLQTTLERLPSSQREAFELMRLDGLSCEEAAQVLGISPSALKFRAHRATVALKAALRTA